MRPVGHLQDLGPSSGQQQPRKPQSAGHSQMPPTYATARLMQSGSIPAAGYSCLGIDQTYMRTSGGGGGGYQHDRFGGGMAWRSGVAGDNGGSGGSRLFAVHRPFDSAPIPQTPQTLQAGAHQFKGSALPPYDNQYTIDRTSSGHSIGYPHTSLPPLPASGYMRPLSNVYDNSSTNGSGLGIAGGESAPSSNSRVDRQSFGAHVNERSSVFVQQMVNYSFMMPPGVRPNKRPRRRYEEIERIYHCNFPKCTKAYGTLNHLNAHVAMQNHGKKRTREEFKETRRLWKLKKKQQERQESAHQESLEKQPAQHEDSAASKQPPQSLQTAQPNNFMSSSEPRMVDHSLVTVPEYSGPPYYGFPYASDEQSFDPS